MPTGPDYKLKLKIILNDTENEISKSKQSNQNPKTAKRRLSDFSGVVGNLVLWKIYSSQQG
jgi:hypothetical protein